MSDEILNNRYRLSRRLGEGGMAEVYLAEDVRLGRQVAVKVLRPQYASDKTFLERFIYEARAIAGFSHPNVVNVYDVGRDGLSHYIVMEFVDGQDLRQLLRRAGTLSTRQALDLARQIALGIGYAHRKGLVHRDVKPGNILIDRRGVAKVADFGIAKALSGAGITEPGVVWGTTAYLSPEQVNGTGATPASDVYAIGIVLYEMLAGAPPFKSEDRVAVALKHLHEEPPPFPASARVPPEVDRLVRTALRKAPQERFQNANEIARAIEQVERQGLMEMTAPRSQPPPTIRTETGRASPPVTAAAPPPRPVPAPEPEMGPDWLTIVMLIAVILLAAGLVPLYQRVFDLLG